MKKYLLIVSLFAILSAKSQSILVNRYVDDRINPMTYLHFKPDGTFEFRYANDLMGDEAIGRYTIHRDTLLLTFTKDTSISGFTYFEHPTGVRADSLLIKKHKLYEIKNGKNREYEPQDTVHHRPPKSWHYRRKYFLFGYWHSNYSRYYMVDERHAKWATKKWLKQNTALFQ
ncbi:hypothetical protein [Mucilaginibacter sp.]|uniref:hypothetical protein n=1 Tax=Mucilaginibacter sp. TaxID=1882438 RepID=UPI003D151E42